MTPRTPQEAYDLLIQLGATPRLIRHLTLVGEAVEELIAGYKKLRLILDADLVRVGAAVHDAGKVEHPEELNHHGSSHEAAGQAMLLANGVSPAIAEFCVTHADWQRDDISIEALTVALADKLWKGKRIAELELRLVDKIALQLSVDRWSIYSLLDDCFERIASSGDQRLARSM